MRVPLDDGCSPSPASITPAFTSSSLNFPISVSMRSSGITPASESLLALTITRNRMAISLSHLRYGSVRSALYAHDERHQGKSTSANLVVAGPVRISQAKACARQALSLRTGHAEPTL